jgi:hypothetical protein
MKNAIVLAIIVGMGFPTLQAQDAFTAGMRALGSRDTTAALSAFRKADKQPRTVSQQYPESLCSA